MTDPLHTEPVEVTQADVHAAALQWCGEKDRETSLDDVRYFENNWQSLPGLRSRVEAFARHRTAAEAASRAREDALRGLIGDAYETLKRIEQGADEALVAAAAKEACDKIDAALSPAAKGGDHG